MKKSSLIILLSVLLVVTGCEKQDETQVISNGEKVDTKNMVHEHCTREANAQTGVEVNLNYDIYYTGDVLNLLKSQEQVVSADNSVLDTYQESYTKINKNYEGIKYYDSEVKRGDTSVTYNIVINYDEIDLDKLIEIEGSEVDFNGEKYYLYKDGKASASEWKKLAKKVGAKCKKDNE